MDVVILVLLLVCYYSFERSITQYYAYYKILNSKGFVEFKVTTKNSIDLALNTKPNNEPDDYNKTNCSDKVVKIIQSYTSIVNREVWKK